MFVCGVVGSPGGGCRESQPSHHPSLASSHGRLVLLGPVFGDSVLEFFTSLVT